MKAKCPHCETGCGKCDGGQIDVSLAKGNIFTRVCQNSAECGFVNGGYVSDSFPMRSSGECQMCGSETQWMLMEEAPTEEAWQKPDNYLKWTVKGYERCLEGMRAEFRKVQQLALDILNGKSELALNDYKTLGVCRICRKPYSAPFVLNYGDEYAHSGCLQRG